MGRPQVDQKIQLAIKTLNAVQPLINHRELARRFKVSATTVRRILRGPEPSRAQRSRAQGDIREKVGVAYKHRCIMALLERQGIEIFDYDTQTKAGHKAMLARHEREYKELEQSFKV